MAHRTTCRKKAASEVEEALMLCLASNLFRHFMSEEEIVSASGYLPFFLCTSEILDTDTKCFGI